MILVSTYIAYLAASFVVTIWVASTLHKNGRIFLVDAFGGNLELADSVNHLLVVGFYLINLGYATAMLKASSQPGDAAQGIELFSEKIGFMLLILGVMHFLNLFIFSRVRRRALLANMAPPVAPQSYLAAQAKPVALPLSASLAPSEPASIESRGVVGVRAT